MSELASRLVGNALLHLLRPIGYLHVICRRFARWLLQATVDDWLLVRHRGRLRYKIIRHRRKPFRISNDKVFWWTGKQATVTLEIPIEISQEEARILCLAQTIDPRFAEQLFETMHSTIEYIRYIRDEIESRGKDD